MSFTEPLYLLFLTTGLAVGFGHCIGMCGPIVVALSMGTRGRTGFWPHLLYNAGRITTYVILGALVGFSGSFTGLAAQMAGLQKAAYIFSGVLICLMGLVMGGWLRFGRVLNVVYQPQGVLFRGVQRFLKVGWPAYFPLGMLWGFLPCGPVYTALVAAAGAGLQATEIKLGVAAGAGLMLAFGLGTLPALLLVAGLSDLGWLKAKTRIFKIGALLMVVTGLYIIFKAVGY